MDPDKPDMPAIQEAARVIRDGGIVVFPTETVYGAGANAYDAEAVAGIFAAKGRPGDNPLIVHIADRLWVEDIAEDIPEAAYKLMERFWPGPLTLILKKRRAIPDAVTAKLDTVAVRMPLHRIAYELIRESKLPIAAPSANLSGKPSPTNASHVIGDLLGRVDAIIDGGRTSIGLESTVLDMTAPIPEILRPGGVTKEDLEDVIGEVIISKGLILVGEVIKSKSLVLDGFTGSADSGSGLRIAGGEGQTAPKSPGMKYRHYAPKAGMILFKGSQRQIAARINLLTSSLNHPRGQISIDKVGVLASSELIALLNDSAVVLPVPTGHMGSIESFAEGMYDSLRKMDEMNVDLVLSECVPQDGLGLAVMDRLIRAASGRVIDTGRFREILFVCTGNTCRSCMAEAFFNSAARELSSAAGDSPDRRVILPFATSAGVSAFADDGASGHSIDVLKEEWDISLENHRARLLTDKMAAAADLVLTMGHSHKSSILRAFPNTYGKVFTLLEFTDGSPSDISDPYGSSEDVYRDCATQIKSAVDKLIDIIS